MVKGLPSKLFIKAEISFPDGSGPLGEWIYEDKEWSFIPRFDDSPFEERYMIHALKCLEKIK